jgi:hypothetical protein
MPDTVKVEVIGGPYADVAWREGMSALSAMIEAQSIIEPNPNEQFTFALQHYTGLGFLVIMINETYDSFISRGGETASPFFYWNVKVGGSGITTSVEKTILRAGDVLTFDFGRFDPNAHSGTMIETKHNLQTKK